MLEEFTSIAMEIAEALKARGEKVAVVDGATGGLISASLLTVPGALAFYVGGGILYSERGRSILTGLAPETFKGMRSATEPYALLQARAIRDNFGSDWGVAETGAAGGSIHPRSIEAGHSVSAVVGPGIERTFVLRTGSNDRVDNMRAFTMAALHLLSQTLRVDRG